MINRLAVIALDVEAAFVGDELAVLDVAAQQAKVHRPAVAGDAPVVIGLGPAGVVEADLSRAVVEGL